MAETKKKAEEVAKPVEIVKHESLAEALAYAMLDYEPLEKNNEVDFQTNQGKRVNYKYADLAHIRKVTDPHLLKHGLVITDRQENREGKEYQVTTMRHIHSDQSDSTELEITEASNNMQDLGGNKTYAKRYNYCDLTGRIAADDNDARDVKRKNESQQPSRSSGSQGSKSPLELRKIDYHKLLTENKVFDNDDDRHKWQGIATGKASSKKWNKADTEQAIDLMHWRLVVGKESDALVKYLNTSAKSTKGLHDQFLAVMGANKVTNIKNVEHWTIGMGAALLSITHESEEALAMGKVLMRADEHEGLFDLFLKAMEIEKMTTMNKEQVIEWKSFLDMAVKRYNVEHKEEPVEFDKLMNPPEETLL